MIPLRLLVLALFALAGGLLRAAPAVGEAKPKELPAAPALPTSPAAAEPKSAKPGSASEAPVATEPELTPAESAPASGPAPATPVAHGVISAMKAKGPPPVLKTPVVATPLSPRFQQIRTRIGTLFDQRLNPPPAPDATVNPFRAAGTAPPAALPAAAANNPDNTLITPAPASNDLALLQQAVATLKVKGIVQLGTRLQLVIGSGPGKEGTYKEGDFINVNLPGVEAVHLRLRQVRRNSVTLMLNDAEMTLKF